MSQRMPVLFVGHGSPMNAIEDNNFRRSWQQLGLGLPKPKAILCISAQTVGRARGLARTRRDAGVDARGVE